MADCVAIAPELPFRAQVTELATHLSRCVPSASDPSASKEFIASYESQLKEGEEEDESKRKEVIRSIVNKVKEVGGALEGLKESDVESSHLLLQYVISTTFEGAEYEEVFRSVLDGLKKGVEAYAAQGRTTRLEVAARILNNTYNSLPPTSSLRAPTLLSLLSALSKFTDLSILPLSPIQLSTAAEQWSISTSEKVSFLGTAADIYRSTQNYATAYDILILALRYEQKSEIAEKAAVVAVLDEKRFSVEGLVNAESLTGEAKELVQLLGEEDAVEAVKKGGEWVKSKSEWIKARGIAQFTPETILSKLRLLALAQICSTSQTRTLSYADISSSLSISESEVESWVFDAITSNLIKARISQPAKTVRIISVSSAADRAFGPSQWELLEKRLGEWKGAVEEARKVVGEAEEMGKQGPITQQQRRYQGGDRREKGGNGDKDQQQREEVMA